MILSLLILLPLIGTLIIFLFYTDKNEKLLKITALAITIINLFISLIIWFLFDNSSKSFQFVQEHYTVSHYDFYLGLDGLSIYFVLLTTLIAPISIISNWKSINSKTAYFLVIILLLESALLLIYSVLDILMFYIFFESILAPLFILIGFFGSTDKLRASFYFFLYTFLGSLFMLLSIITISSLTGCTDMDIIYKIDYAYITQVFLFMGIFVAFAVKTPVIFLNTWLLKAHVESPLSGSVILAAIVLKLSLYGVFRLILPLLPKAFMFYTHIVFVICVITILYASFSTIRTIDVKELIAYSSVSHAAVYFAGILSNVMQGIQGGILLGLAHGFVSSGLFISGGGVLYDRSSTRTINYYGGLAQVMPIFSILFFILCLGNCGAPLTLNFVGEFMSLYGIFERLSIAGILASSSIVLSAVYTVYMFNRIIFGGVFKGWYSYLPDLNKREYSILLVLVIFTIALGVYPSIILDSLNYEVSRLVFVGCTTFILRNWVVFNSNIFIKLKNCIELIITDLYLKLKNFIEPIIIYLHIKLKKTGYYKQILFVYYVINFYFYIITLSLSIIHRFIYRRMAKFNVLIYPLYMKDNSRFTYILTYAYIMAACCYFTLYVGIEHDLFSVINISFDDHFVFMDLRKLLNHDIGEGIKPPPGDPELPKPPSYKNNTSVFGPPVKPGRIPACDLDPCLFKYKGVYYVIDDNDLTGEKLRLYTNLKDNYEEKTIDFLKSTTGYLIPKMSVIASPDARHPGVGQWMDIQFYGPATTKQEPIIWENDKCFIFKRRDYPPRIAHRYLG